MTNRALTQFASPDKWEAMFGANYLRVLAFFDALRLTAPAEGDLLEFIGGRWRYSTDAVGSGGGSAFAVKDFLGDGVTVAFVFPGIVATKALYVSMGGTIIQTLDLDGDPQWAITSGGGDTTITFAEAPPAPDADQPQGTLNIQVAVA